MAAHNIEGRIPGPLETCREKAETYYRHTLKQLDYDKGQKVQTKYGSTWTYRLGPSEGHGPKLLFIHGINTSCHSLADIATPLSKNGCQVLLYDLYGRGLSDGTAAKHDARLYTDQAKEVLEKYGWTKDITVIGYSMGGSVAVHINKSHPGLIKDLILLAPAGMIRHRTLGLDKFAVFRFLPVPTRAHRYLIKKNLQQGIDKVKSKTPQLEFRSDVIDEVVVGLGEPVVGLEEAVVGLEEAVCQSRMWSIENHDGFVKAVKASVSEAPLCRQNEAWEILKKRKGTTMVILGSEDDKVVLSEFKEDVRKLKGGAGHLHLETLEGTDHHFPMTDAGKVLEIITPVLGVEVTLK